MQKHHELSQNSRYSKPPESFQTESSFTWLNYFSWRVFHHNLTSIKVLKCELKATQCFNKSYLVCHVQVIPISLEYLGEMKKSLATTGVYPSAVDDMLQPKEVFFCISSWFLERRSALNSPVVLIGQFQLHFLCYSIKTGINPLENCLAEGLVTHSTKHDYCVQVHNGMQVSKGSCPWERVTCYTCRRLSVQSPASPVRTEGGKSHSEALQSHCQSVSTHRNS